MTKRKFDSMRVPDLVSVNVDRTKPHFTFRMPSKFVTEAIIPQTVNEMVAIGRFTDARLEGDRHIALELNADKESMPEIMASVRENLQALLGDNLGAADEPIENDRWQLAFNHADGVTLKFEAPRFGNLYTLIEEFLER